MRISMYAVSFTTDKGQSKIVYPRATSDIAAQQKVERQLAQRAMKATINGVRKV